MNNFDRHALYVIDRRIMNQQQSAIRRSKSISVVIFLICLFGCSSEPFNFLGIHDVSLRDYAGCYRIRDRRFAGFDGVVAWWNVKNICFDGDGNWIESNGLNIKYGRMIRPHDNSFDFELETDTISYTVVRDSFSGNINFSSIDYRLYTKAAISITIYKSDDDGFQIYGESAAPLSCWEFILPTDTFALWKGTKINKPRYCPRSLDDILGSSGWQEKTE